MNLLISVVLCTMRAAFKKNIFNNFLRQDFPDKEMIIVLNDDKMNLEEWKEETKEYGNIHVYKVKEETTLGECLNFGISKASFDVIAKFDDDDYYSNAYLSEAYQALISNKADIVGKCASYIYFEQFHELMILRPGHENQIRRKLKGGTLVFKKHVWHDIKFENRVAGSDTCFLKEAFAKNYKLYSTSSKNYLCIRRRDLSSHTQKLSSYEYRKRCKLVAKGKNILNFFDISEIPSISIKLEDKLNKTKQWKKYKKNKRKFKKNADKRK